MSKSKQQYWLCIVGPVDERVPFGGDFPLRMAVQDMFEGDIPIASGWGMDEEEYREIKKVRQKHFLKRINKKA